MTELELRAFWEQFRGRSDMRSALLIEPKARFVELVAELAARSSAPRGFEYLPRASSTLWVIPGREGISVVLNFDLFVDELKPVLLGWELDSLPDGVREQISLPMTKGSFDELFDVRVIDYVSDGSSMVDEAIQRLVFET